MATRKRVPTIDIRTAIVQPEQTMWAMHAGGSRKFADTFRDQSVIFLDLPGVQLSAEVLKDATMLRRHVRMSEAVVKYHRAIARGKTATVSRDPSYYRVRHRGESKAGLSARLGNVYALFQEMKEGDIVFVPQFDGGVSRIAAGIVRDSFSSRFVVHHESYPGEKIPARHVEWIGQPALRKDFGGDLSLRFSNRHAIIRLQRNLRRPALAPIYRNVAVDNSSQCDIQGRAYDGKKIFSLIDAINLLNDNIAFIGERTLGGQIAIARAGTVPSSRAAIESALLEFGVEFHSPGSFRTALKGAVGAAVLVGLLHCFISDYPQDVLANSVSITNSVAANDTKVSPEAQTIIRSIMSDLDANEFNNIRQRSKKSVKEIGLDVDGQLE